MTMPADWRPHGHYGALDTSKLSSGAAASLRSLLIGQQLAAGTATAGDLVRIFSADDANTYFGQASQLAQMCAAYLDNDPYCELWAIPLDDNVAGTQATYTITIGGTATAAGTLYIYVGATRYELAVASSDSANTIATNLDALLGAEVNLPFTSGVVAPAVTLTARNGGTLANDVPIVANRAGAASGEELPAGVTCTIAAGVTAANDPAISTAITSMGDNAFRWIGYPYYDDTSQAAVLVEMARRWGATVGLRGHTFNQYQGTASAATTWGELAAQNSRYRTTFAWEDEAATPWEAVGAGMGAHAARVKSLTVVEGMYPGAGRPDIGQVVQGVLPARLANAWTQAELNLIYKAGLSPLSVSQDPAVAKLAVLVTQYQTDAGGGEDDSLRHVQTIEVIDELMTKIDGFFSNLIEQGYKLSGDADTDADMVYTTGDAFADYARLARQMKKAGLIENIDALMEALTVTKTLNRLDGLFPPDLIDMLLQVVTTMQPRLNEPTV